MTGKKTVIIGASEKPLRYSHIAAIELKKGGHPVVLFNIKKGILDGEQILDIRSKPVIDAVDTITIYIAPRHQPDWYDYILAMAPTRIIFNPGTQNLEFAEMARLQDIEVVEACTLVMLRVGAY